ncbi:MAG: APC family permease [Pseudomonadales bacterium]
MNRNDAVAPQAHITAHDSHYRAEPDLLDKGLAHDSIGLSASVAMAVSCVAPVYALTVALGPTVREVGLQLPAVLLAGFVPMLLVAFAYRALNKVIPDAGTSFTWTVKAFGPYTGWMCGWGLIIATVIVLSNTAGVAATFFYLFLAQLLDNPDIAAFGARKPVNVLTTSAMVALATWVAWRGMMTAKRVTYVLVAVQMVALAVFCLLAFRGIASGTVPTAISFEWNWLNPFSVKTVAALVSGLSLSIFIYWGWDVCLSANEETRGSEHTPAAAALLSIMALAGTYVLVAIATQMYAGIGDTGIGLGSPDTHDNVFAALATPIMGHPLDLLLYGAVLASAASSLQTTFIPAARTMLAMSVYRAMPAIFARIHPRHQVPSNATIAAGVLTAAFYAVMTWLSENVLSDTVESLGMMICFYYGLTALSCVWYFRHEYRIGLGPLITKGLLPLLGGGMLAAMFVQLCVTTFDPGYGSGGAIFGVGTVFAIGVGILLLGAVLMIAWRLAQPAFFRGETLRHDTPALIVEDPPA